ncbi:MAG: O-antigen ligase family protein [Acidimicrobiia bacterium]
MPRWALIMSLVAASTAIPVVAVAASSQMAFTSVVALAIGLILVFAIALTRFELLTFLMVAARTAIDITHTDGNLETLRLSVLATGAYTVTAIFWLVARRIERPLRASWVAISAGAVSLAAVLSGVLSSDREQALLGASRWVFLAIFLVVLENSITDQNQVRRLVIAVGLSTLVPLSLGTWQLLIGTGQVIDGIARIDGSFSHPNTYGFYLAMVALGLISIISHIPRWYRVGGSGLLALLVVNLLATYSRTSYVAFSVGLLVIALVGRHWALLIMTLVAASGLSLIPSVAERFADLGEGQTIRGTPGDSLAWRLEYWPEVIAVGEGRRVTGLGLGLASDATAQGREPHNDLVRAYVEMGSIGLVSYLIFLLALAWQAWRAISRSGSATGSPALARSLAVGFAGIFAAYLVGSLTGNLMTQLILLWYVVALAVATGLPTRTPTREFAQLRERVDA